MLMKYQNYMSIIAIATIAIASAHLKYLERFGRDDSKIVPTRMVRGLAVRHRLGFDPRGQANIQSLSGVSPEIFSEIMYDSMRCCAIPFELEAT